MRLEVRPPHPAEEAVCRMLLPETSTDSALREYRLATSDAAPFYLDAASWLRVPGSIQGLQIRVVHTLLRQGIGSSLLEAVVDEAARHSCGELHCQADAVSEPAAAAFLKARGFRHTGFFRGFETDLEPILAYAGNCSSRLRQAGKIPADARIVRLREAPAGETARLYTAYIAANPELPSPCVQSVMEAAAFDESRVLMRGDRVMGMILGTVEEPRIQVEAWVIAPELRGRWATLLLLAETTRAGWDLGGRRIRFHASDRAGETLSLARRFGADPIDSQDRYCLRIGG